MNRQQRRTAKAKNKDKPYVARLAIRGPNDPLRRGLMSAIAETLELQIPGTWALADRDRATILLSLTAAFVARIPAAQGRQKMLADIPTVFRDLVSANVATGIVADRFEEEVGGITPQKLQEAGAFEAVVTPPPPTLTAEEAHEIAEECIQAVNYQTAFIARSDKDAVQLDEFLSILRPKKPATIKLIEATKNHRPMRGYMTPDQSDTSVILVATTVNSIGRMLSDQGFAAEAQEIDAALKRSDDAAMAQTETKGNA